MPSNDRDLWVFLGFACLGGVCSRCRTTGVPARSACGALTRGTNHGVVRPVWNRSRALDSCQAQRHPRSSSGSASHGADARFGENPRLPAYTLNQDALRHAKRLIDARRYVLRSRWQDVQPRAREQNAFLKTHSWEEYAAWHLGLTEGAAEETKARYAFVYGDFRRLHRMGLVACHYRAAEWRHKEIELAAHELLQYLDRKTA